MATENKGVMVYLPKEVEEYITNFCTEYNITRKDKEGNTLPSLGTGIVTYLKSQMMGESPSDVLAKPNKSLSNGLTKDEVLDLIREYSTSHVPSDGLTKDEVIDLIHEYGTSHVLSNGLTEDEVLELIHKHGSSESYAERDKPNPSPKPRPEGALDRNELSEKLGKSRQSIELRRDKGTLDEWGYRAEKIGSNWYYFPLDQSNQP